MWGLVSGQQPESGTTRLGFVLRLERTIEIVGEPRRGGADVLADRKLTSEDFAMADLAEAKAVVAPSDTASAPQPGDLFFALATSMIAHTDLRQPETDIFNRVLEQGVDLRSLRNEFGETLWVPWSEAWETASAISEADIRGPVLSRLTAIADKLTEQGVNINDQQGRRTPIAQAAIADMAATLAELQKRGADVNGFDRSGLTPLLAAAFYGSEAATNYLLEHGANIELVSREPTGTAEADAAGESFVELEAEACEPSSTPMECAEQGKALVFDDPERLREYESIISMIWDRQN
jgi:hypothetical protein